VIRENISGKKAVTLKRKREKDRETERDREGVL